MRRRGSSQTWIGSTNAPVENTQYRARTTDPHFGTNGIGDASTEDALRRWRNLRKGDHLLPDLFRWGLNVDCGANNKSGGGCVGVKCSAHSTPRAETSRIESKAGASVSNRRRLCTRYAHAPPKAARGRASGAAMRRQITPSKARRQGVRPPATWWTGRQPTRSWQGCAAGAFRKSPPMQIPE